MVRKMIVVQTSGASPVLTETPADNEFQLQELLKNNPDLVPVDEFGMTGPLMVVGRETTLASGAVDLVCLAATGELLIVEFKTGPQNSDFRHSLAQLLDYGSNLWEMSLDEFESTVAARYFSSEACRDPRLRGRESLAAAIDAFWPDMSGENRESLKTTLAEQLRSGGLHYVLAAQRFTPTMERTITYMNATSGKSRFYAIELVRFASNGIDAFEARTVLKPKATSGSDPTPATDEARFLAAVENDGYRQALHELFEVFRGLTFRTEWGPSGTSFRMRTPDRTEPLSIAWVFPESRTGWQGLRGLNLGFDTNSARNHPSVSATLERYLDAVKELPGVMAARAASLRVYQIPPATLIEHHNRVAEILAALVQDPTA